MSRILEISVIGSNRKKWLAALLGCPTLDFKEPLILSSPRYRMNVIKGSYIEDMAINIRVLSDTSADYVVVVGSDIDGCLISRHDLKSKTIKHINEIPLSYKKLWEPLDDIIFEFKTKKNGFLSSLCVGAAESHKNPPDGVVIEKKKVDNAEIIRKLLGI